MLRKIKEEGRGDAKNHAESLIYTTEKNMKDMGEKISADDRQRIETEIANVRSALQNGTVDTIKSASEKLTEVSYEVFGKIYQQEAAQAQQANSTASSANANDDAPIDAEYEVVDDDKNN